MNDGLLNHLGIWAYSISSENGDRAALRRAQLMASIVVLWHLCHSGDADLRLANSHDLSLDWREPLWWDNSPWISPVLLDPFGYSPWFRLQHLPCTSNSKSLTCFRKHSNSWSLKSYCTCSRMSDANLYSCKDPSPEPDHSPSCLYHRS